MGPPQIAFSDVIGHDARAFIAETNPRAYRRNVIVDRIEQLSPEFLTWARLPPDRRGPPPALELGKAAEIGRLMTEYAALLPA